MRAIGVIDQPKIKRITHFNDPGSSPISLIRLTSDANPIHTQGIIAMRQAAGWTKDRTISNNQIVTLIFI